MKTPKLQTNLLHPCSSSALKMETVGSCGTLVLHNQKDSVFVLITMETSNSIWNHFFMFIMYVLIVTVFLVISGLTICICLQRERWGGWSDRSRQESEYADGVPSACGTVATSMHVKA